MKVIFYLMCLLCVCSAVRDDALGRGENVIVADPLIPHPDIVPCKVHLFDFDFTGKQREFDYEYDRDKSCGDLWSLVVLNLSCGVTAGRQYDRSAFMQCGDVSIFAGTTQEPSEHFGPTWTVQNDVTWLSSVFTTSQSCVMNLGTVVNDIYTGVPHCSADLLFYTQTKYPKPSVPDKVYGLGLTDIKASDPFKNITLTFPRNMDGLYLDIITQGQGEDEFFSSCAPSSVADKLLTCGNSAFRQVMVSIDDTPVGLAPIFPWVFTGGIDPYLWRPTPAVQALHLLPFRMDLTPFVVLLNDGQPHTVSVFIGPQINDHWTVTGNLYAFLDHHSTAIGGHVIINSLSRTMEPTIRQDLDIQGTTIHGTIQSFYKTEYTILSLLRLSYGDIVIETNHYITFNNDQTYDLKSHGTNTTSFKAVTSFESNTSKLRNRVRERSSSYYEYPFSTKITVSAGDQPNILKQNSDVQQKFILRNFYQSNSTDYNSEIENSIQATDTMFLNTKENHVVGNEHQASHQAYQFKDDKSNCYHQEIFNANNTFINSITGRNCINGNKLSWWVDPFFGRNNQP